MQLRQNLDGGQEQRRKSIKKKTCSIIAKIFKKQSNGLGGYLPTHKIYKLNFYRSGVRLTWMGEQDLCQYFTMNLELVFVLCLLDEWLNTFWTITTLGFVLFHPLLHSLHFNLTSVDRRITWTQPLEDRVKVCWNTGVSVRTAAFLWNRVNSEQSVWSRLLAPVCQCRSCDATYSGKVRRKRIQIKPCLKVVLNHALQRSCSTDVSTTQRMEWLSSTISLHFKLTRANAHFQTKPPCNATMHRKGCPTS